MPRASRRRRSASFRRAFFEHMHAVHVSARGSVPSSSARRDVKLYAERKCAVLHHCVAATALCRRCRGIIPARPTCVRIGAEKLRARGFFFTSKFKVEEAVLCATGVCFDLLDQRLVAPREVGLVSGAHAPRLRRAFSSGNCKADKAATAAMERSLIPRARNVQSQPTVLYLHHMNANR